MENELHLSIIIPVFNEQGNLKILIKQITGMRDQIRYKIKLKAREDR